MSTIPGVVDLSVEKQVLIPQITVRIDQRKAAQAGISPGEAVRILKALTDGAHGAQIVDGVKRYELVLRLPDGARTPQDLERIAAGWYGLGPISVLPQRQGRGIGSRPMEQVLSELRAMQAAGCVLLGDPAYYARFGFEARAGLQLPGVPPGYFMALALRGPVPEGIAQYSDAFNAAA